MAGQEPDLTESTRQRVVRLSASYRAALEQMEDDRAALWAAIGDADEEGVGVRELARLADLSPSHVQRIIAGETAERQASTG